MKYSSSSSLSLAAVAACFCFRVRAWSGLRARVGLAKSDWNWARAASVVAICFSSSWGVRRPKGRFQGLEVDLLCLSGLRGDCGGLD